MNNPPNFPDWYHEVCHESGYAYIVSGCLVCAECGMPRSCQLTRDDDSAPPSQSSTVSPIRHNYEARWSAEFDERMYNESAVEPRPQGICPHCEHASGYYFTITGWCCMLCDHSVVPSGPHEAPLPDTTALLSTAHFINVDADVVADAASDYPQDLPPQHHPSPPA